MAFWQENQGFIKDVYDNRSEKLVEIMDKTDGAIEEVLADKIYTSNEFKKVKESFFGLAKNLENGELIDWLQSTKETLMGDRDTKQRGAEDNKLAEVLGRFDKLVPKVGDTKLAVDSLWKSYQYTDELTPHMEWLAEKKQLATRDINSNSAGETEDLIEKQEKVIDQLDKKRRVFKEILSKGEKLRDVPKCPPFLGEEVKRASDLWDETNKLALDRLNRLRDNCSAWERYENKRNDLTNKLNDGDKELQDIKKIYELTAGTDDLSNRLKTAKSIRKDIEEVFKTVKEANDIVQVLLTDEMKTELNEQVEELKQRSEVNKLIDDKLAAIYSFNGKLKLFIDKVAEMENWNIEGRKSMNDLLNPPAPMEAEDKVLKTMELGDDIRDQIETHQEQQTIWNEELAPNQSGEESNECKELSNRMITVGSDLETLNNEAGSEAAKFGEDVKHLADVTNSNKKFAPWIKKSEEKVKVGMGKASSLQEANKQLEEVKVWKAECEKMKKVLDNGNEAAMKMTMHEEADKQYGVNIKRWEGVNGALCDWINKLEALVKMWDEQAATADKVTAALSAPAASDMKLEDLEAHLNALKKMFIEKQKMMDCMNVHPPA